MKKAVQPFVVEFRRKRVVIQPEKKAWLSGNIEVESDRKNMRSSSSFTRGAPIIGLFGRSNINFG